MTPAPTGGDEERIAELCQRVAGPHVGSIYEEESYFREATEFLLDLLSRSALSSAPDERNAAIDARLKSLAALRDDWDSYGAKAPDVRAMERARQVCVVLAFAPSLVPTTSGGVQLEWHRDGLDIEIDIPAEGATEFYLEGRSALPSEDSQRLDFLETSHRGMEYVTCDDEQGEPTRHFWMVDDVSLSDYRITIREAIDRARHLSSTPKGV